MCGGARRSWAVLWAVCAALLALASPSLALGTFLAPPSHANATFEVVSLDEPTVQASVFGVLAGRLVFASLSDGQDIRDCWVADSAVDFLFREQRPAFFSAYAQRGAVGFVQFMNYPDSAALGFLSKPNSRGLVDNYPLHFPIVLVKNATAQIFKDLNKLNETIILNLTSDDKDVWVELRSGWLIGIFQVSLAPIAVANIGLASVKLYSIFFYSGHRSKMTVASVCLLLEVVANILRFIWLTFDPMLAYGGLPEIAGQVLATVHISFSLSISLLICLYWHELLQKAKLKSLATKVSFLSNMRKPFIVIVVLMFCVELASSIARGFPGLDISPLTITCGVIYVILTISTTIFFFWNGFRIIVFFRATPRNDTRSRRLKNATWMIVLSGFAGIPLLVGECIAVTDFIWQPVGWLLFFSCEIGGFVRILAFHAPNRDSGPSSTHDGTTVHRTTDHTSTSTHKATEMTTNDFTETGTPKHGPSTSEIDREDDVDPVGIRSTDPHDDTSSSNELQ